MLEKNGKSQIFLHRNFFPKNSNGQIWVETVIYTLILLVMIGSILTFAIPKISEIRDKSTIEQSINLIKDINEVITSVVQGGLGNKRVIEVNIKRGNLLIDGINNRIIFEMTTDYAYSENGRTISLGSVDATTRRTGGTNTFTLLSVYSYDITYNGEDDEKTLTQSTTPYKLSVENKGTGTNGKANIDFNLL